MTFWILIPLLTILAVAFVVVPVWRLSRTAAEPSPDGVMAAATSLWRRRTMLWLVPMLAAVVAIPAIALYASVGRPELGTVESRVNAAVQARTANGGTPASSMASMIAGLRDKVRQNPRDADAWATLGWAFMHIRQPGDATQAYNHAISLAPDNMEYRSALAEATIQDGSGKIPAATAADLRKIVAADPGDARARFYLALYKDQQGDHKGAVADWITLLNAAPVGSGWAPEVRRVVEQVAKEEHIDISTQLPPQPGITAAPGTMPGPNAEQVAAARQMPAGKRSMMIQGMVDRLAARLQKNPRDAEGWQKLIRARMVLGEKDQALAAYRAAHSAFAGQAAVLAALDDTARSLGVTGG
jgi:cytochrome c-type biogenesis protein CcmH